MSAYTITWETYRAMQDRITALEQRNSLLEKKVLDEISAEILLLEAEREIARLNNKLKGE